MQFKRDTLLGIALLILFIGTLEASGQACGRSTYTVSIFVRNGTEANNLRYRVYPLGHTTSELLKNSLKKLFPYRNFSYSEMYGQVENEHAEKFIRSYRETDYPPPANLQNPGGINRLSGHFENGQVNFFTWETEITPYLIEVKADNKIPHYQVGNFFGGCRRGININLFQKYNGREN